MKWRVDYKLEGSIEVEAETEEEARDEFYTTPNEEIMENCYFGTQITDMVLIDD